MPATTRIRVGLIAVSALGACLLLPGGAAAVPPAPLPAATIATPPAPLASPTATEPTADAPTASPTPPTPSPTPTATPTPTAAPPPATVTPSPTPTGMPPGVEEDTQEPAGVLPGIPPAASTGNQAPITWLIAMLVLLASMGVLLVVRHHDDEPQTIAESGPPDGAGDDLVSAQLEALESLGEALIDAGYSVSTVREVLTDTAAAQGIPTTEIVVFPTALFVSTRGGGSIRTGVVSSGHDPLSLGQIDALSDVVAGARSGRLSPTATSLAIDTIRALPTAYPAWMRVAAYVLMSAALSILLGASWAGVLLASVLGIAVGATQLATAQVQSQYQALVTAATAFGVSAVVLIVSTIGLDAGVLPSLVAPLITFLPGALLTTGIMELSTGQMMAGAGRLAAGAMQLLLLAGGVVAAATLFGVPQLDLTAARNPLGPIAPWIAVAMFGIAMIVYRSGRWTSIGWILLVLYVAYGAQIIGDLFLGSVLSAFVGAAAMTPVAILASRHPRGPAAFVSFLPGFYLLVPGALGLVGVTSLLGGDATGLGTLLTTASTMVAISLGVLTGSALSVRLRREHGLLI